MCGCVWLMAGVMHARVLPCKTRGLRTGEGTGTRMMTAVIYGTREGREQAGPIRRINFQLEIFNSIRYGVHSVLILIK